MEFIELLEAFDKRIKSMSYEFIIYPLEAVDIQQELRIQLFLKYPANKKKIDNFEKWAYVVCRNKIKDLAKHYTRNNRGYHQSIETVNI